MRAQNPSIEAVRSASPQHQEVCICAAIRFDSGEMFRGHRHNDCLRVVWGIPMEQRPKAPPRPAQGFVTSLGRFVDRVEGLRLQIEAGVPSRRGSYQQELYSEDLY